ncbi:FCD domain-containing protein [Roseomonas hellenica]|uniref:FCD domain-containing protein n=1 Tax=Plastoroseomonas hellenica TaxID=2687306 RepID=A0ABS5F758_9PROT|nr:FCD domain-containing protein [Plastoroseomonas hellenica]MBR0668382.1 FCD domain-containing protein [Plastoroseomonas hellenica]
MPRDLPGASLTQTAYERLRADLLACRLRPGERLRIADLCAALGVSLSAVREALSRLTAEGLVVAEPQRGFRAAPISVADLRDLTAARIEIETLCLRRAIASGDVGWEERLVAAHHRLSRTSARDPADPDRVAEPWAEAHGAYHEALVAGCGSPWLLRLRAILYAQSERYRRLSLPLARTERDLAREHREIMDATLARDADRAAALLTAHLQLTSAILLDAEESAEMPALAAGR